MNPAVDLSLLREDSMSPNKNIISPLIPIQTSQDVYLYAASKGLGTVSLGMYDEAAVRKVFKLDAKMNVILAQAVGFPK